MKRRDYILNKLAKKIILSVISMSAVLGVDNIPMGNYLHPRISTVDQDFESMARECVELLTKLIDGEDLGNRKTSVFLPSVIEREST